MVVIWIFYHEFFLTRQIITIIIIIITIIIMTIIINIIIIIIIIYIGFFIHQRIFTSIIWAPADPADLPGGE